MNANELRIEMLRREVLKRGLAPQPMEPEPRSPDIRAFMGKPRVEATHAITMGGRVIASGVSEEMIAAERARLGVSQLSNREIIGMHKRLLGNPPQPSMTEVCEAAGATLKHARLRGWR